MPKLPPGLYKPDPPKNPSGADPAALFLLVFVLLFVGVALATQWMAFRLGFNPTLPGTPIPADPRLAGILGFVGPLLAGLGLLGLPLTFISSKSRRRRLGGALLLLVLGAALWAYSLPWYYVPFRFGHWAYLYAMNPVIAPYVHEGGLVWGAVILVAGLGMWLLAGGRKWKLSGAHGTAAWGDGSWFDKGRSRSAVSRLMERILPERLHGVLFGKDEGIPMGWDGNRMLYDRSGLHTALIAPTGSYKTVGFAIPMLLMHRGSAIAHDVKRELYHVTARRRHELGNEIFRLDPFGEQSASYNPLDLIDTREGHDSLAGDNASMIADMCVVITGNEKQPFFPQETKRMIMALTLSVAYGHEPEVCDEETGEMKPNPKRSLPQVWRVLSLPNDELRDYFRRMQKFRRSEDPDDGRTLREMGANFSGMNAKLFNDVLATARQQLSFVQSPAIQGVLRSSSFQFSDLKTGLATVYLVLPEKRLSTYKRWSRLMIGCARTEIGAIKKRPERPILAAVDELPALGRFEEINEAITRDRSSGLQYVLIAQTIADMEEKLGDKLTQSLIDNPQNRIFLSPSGPKTLEYVSDMGGQTTVATRLPSSNRSKGKHGTSSGESIQEAGRPLIMKNEALKLSNDYCFIFTRGQSALVLKRPDYLEDALFSGLADPNPEHATHEAFEAARRRRVELGIEKPRPVNFKGDNEVLPPQVQHEDDPLGGGLPSGEEDGPGHSSPSMEAESMAMDQSLSR